MDDTRYNGWTNYETWLVNLWLTNEEATQAALYEMAAEHKDEPEYVLADAIQAYTDELIGRDDLQGMLSDLVGAALSNVDWREIAHSARSE